MSKLYLIGHKTPITISKETARKVAEIKSNVTILPNHVLSLDDIVCEKREIKSVVINDYDDNQSEASDKRKDDNTDYYAETFTKYENELQKRCKTPIDVKAKNTKVYELVYEAYTQKQAPEIFKEEVAKRQREYFVKHPRHPYAGVNIKDLIPQPQSRQEVHISHRMGEHMLKKMLMVMAEGLQTAREKGYA